MIRFGSYQKKSKQKIEDKINRGKNRGRIEEKIEEEIGKKRVRPWPVPGTLIPRRSRGGYKYIYICGGIKKHYAFNCEGILLCAESHKDISRF